MRPEERVLPAGHVRAEPAAALYECETTHVRRTPLRHAQRHRTSVWRVALDRRPLLPGPVRPLARFDTRALMAHRPGYADHVARRPSGCIPLPPRRARAGE